MNKFIVMACAAGVLLSCNESQQQAAKRAAEETKETASTLVNTVASGGVTGIYEGLLPCADCAGIETRIYLFADSSFVENSLYLGKPNSTTFTASGKWSQESGTITLSQTGSARKYKLGISKLTLLDTEGKEIQSSLKDRYILAKTGDF